VLALALSNKSKDEFTDDQQGFHKPLQSSDQILQTKSEDESSLEGSKEQVPTPVQFK
jgi:hypothetical protein